MHITLKAGEKIFINGAVLRVDRKTSVELMNDAVFLLEAHVMVERDATTPLRQLYFIVQLMLMEGKERPENRAMFARQTSAMARVYEDRAILTGIAKVSDLVARSRPFEALKAIRALLPVEAALTGRPHEATVRIKPAASPSLVPSRMPTPNPMPALAAAC